MAPTQRAHATLPNSDASRRLVHVTAAARRWLAHSGSAEAISAARGEGLETLLEDWLKRARPTGDAFAQLPQLAESLAGLAPADPTAGRERMARCFAHALVLQAMAEVEREASRAGHAGVFSSLRAFVDVDPAAAELVELSRSLQMEESTILVALARLRRRLHQRIESALSLWAAPGAQRDDLRRKLRASMTGAGSTP